MRKCDAINSIVLAIKNSFSNNLNERIRNGYINYERQLQAELFHHLKLELAPDIDIWFEQVLNLKTTGGPIFTPDIILSLNDMIIAVIELKYLIFGNPTFKKDIKKFHRLNGYSKEKRVLFDTLVFDKENEDLIWHHRFNIYDKFLSVFIVFGEKECAAFKLKDITKPPNFFHVCGYYSNNSQLKIDFKLS